MLSTNESAGRACSARLEKRVSSANEPRAQISRNGRMGWTALAEENGLQMPGIQVVGDVARNRLPAGVQRVQVSGSELRGNLVAHVEQLAKVRVELRVRWLVPERGDVLRRGPSLHRIRRRELGPDQYQSPWRKARTVHPVLEGAGVNLLGQRQPFAPRLGQADDLLEPGRSRRLQVQPALRLRARARRIGA